MQLFTHLLSSYLQGMGDFFSALLWDDGKQYLLKNKGLVKAGECLFHMAGVA